MHGARKLRGLPGGKQALRARFLCRSSLGYACLQRASSGQVQLRAPKVRILRLLVGGGVAVGYAGVDQPLDFGFFVGDAGTLLGGDDQRLRAVASVECALKLHVLNAALLAGIGLQRRFEHSRIGVQLIRYI
jgi:hypothetical protein